jgi:hypothetical protein
MLETTLSFVPTKKHLSHTIPHLKFQEKITRKNDLSKLLFHKHNGNGLNPNKFLITNIYMGLSKSTCLKLLHKSLVNGKLMQTMISLRINYFNCFIL